MDDKKYVDSIHLLGRIGSFFAVAFMVGIPAVMCTVYNCWPNIGTVLTAGGGLLAMMIPTTISEVLSYTPILGSATYLTFITGNAMNLKLPVAISAQQIAGVESNTPISDAISTMAVALSSLETICIIFLGVLMLRPLQPVLQLPAIQTATAYMVPALFGGLFLGMFAQGGKTYMKNKPLVAAFPLVLTAIALVVWPPLAGYQGFTILAAIPVTIAWAFFLYKTGIVKMVERTPAAPAAEETKEEE